MLFANTKCKRNSRNVQDFSHAQYIILIVILIVGLLILWRDQFLLKTHSLTLTLTDMREDSYEHRPPGTDIHKCKWWTPTKVGATGHKPVLDWGKVKRKMLFSTNTNPFVSHWRDTVYTTMNPSKLGAVFPQLTFLNKSVGIRSACFLNWRRLPLHYIQ